jgi:hypothetical protein
MLNCWEERIWRIIEPIDEILNFLLIDGVIAGWILDGDDFVWVNDAGLWLNSDELEILR